MNILWFSWKDIKHPQAGGAEVLSSEVMKRLAKDGHTVKLITASYSNANAIESLDGVEIHRTGSRLSVYPKALRLFRKSFKKWPDLIIDEMNTIPFGVGFYSKKPRILLTYQLARKVWFYQMVFPLSVIGYLLEPLYLFVLSRRYKTVITESGSTKSDLAKYGFKKSGVYIFRAGTALAPVTKLPKKPKQKTVLFLGSVRPMKRTLDAVKAFEVASDNEPSLDLVIAGDDSGKYGAKVKSYVEKSRHAGKIKMLGRVSSAERLELMKDSYVILVTSIKEGWGLIVTEANTQGTPAIAYDVDGLRDSVKNTQTGLLVKSGDYKQMGLAVNKLSADIKAYEDLRSSAWQWSKQFTFENSYKDFKKIIDSKVN